jgi:hypothetical protein
MVSERKSEFLTIEAKRGGTVSEVSSFFSMTSMLPMQLVMNLINRVVCDDD